MKTGGLAEMIVGAVVLMGLVFAFGWICVVLFTWCFLPIVTWTVALKAGAVCAFLAFIFILWQGP